MLAADVPADQALEVAPGGEAQIPIKAVRGTGAPALDTAQGLKDNGGIRYQRPLPAAFTTPKRGSVVRS